MRKLILMLVGVIIISQLATAQDTSAETKAPVELKPYIDLTAGYAFNKDISAFKTTFSVNNILLQRIGFYTSFEIGKDDYSMNIIGTNITIIPKLYAFLGFDAFSKKGLIHTTTGLRKELGVGYLPYKFIVVRAGWSTAVGPTIAAGFKIPLSK